MSSNKEIKVLQIVRAPLGGIRKHIVSIVESLEANRDFDWSWATSTLEDDVDEKFKDFLPTINSDKIFSLKIIDQPEWGDLKNILKLKRKYKDKNINIIHGHGAKGGLYARILGKIIGAKVVYTPHGGSLHDMFGPIKGFIYSLIEIILYPLTDIYIFESQYSLNQFEKKVTKSKRKILLNRNGISLPAFADEAPKINKSHWVIGSFGALRYIKGHDLIIEAIGILKTKNIICEYRIYGEGEEKNNLLNIINKLNLESQVRIFEKTKDVMEKMKQCDLVVQPSRHESFGYVPLEAMSVGRPVIASNVGGLKEIIKDRVNGLLAEPLSPLSFANLIEEIIFNDQLRMSLVSHARKSVETEFSEKIMLSNLQSCYKNLVVQK
jgi:glycosyltransferase involved in cell wall biosynthesis